MNQIQTFRDLMVWQKSMLLVKHVYAVTKDFPRDEIYGLTSQIRRGAVSVPSNIAEGYGRNSTVDYVRFLRIASGSVYELQTQMEIAADLGYIKCEDHEKLQAITTEIAKMLSSMIGNYLVGSKGLLLPTAYCLQPTGYCLITNPYCAAMLLRNCSLSGNRCSSLPIASVASRVR